MNGFRDCLFVFFTNLDWNDGFRAGKRVKFDKEGKIIMLA